MHEFAWTEPATLAEASALLAEHGDDARLIAGGTALIPGLRQRVLAPTHLVSLARIPDARKGAPQRIDVMGTGFVLGGIVAFGLMLPVLGVVLTSLLKVLIVLVPDRNFTTMAKLATAACVAAVTGAVFILGLGMNLQVWPAFLWRGTRRAMCLEGAASARVGKTVARGAMMARFGAANDEGPGMQGAEARHGNA